MDGCPLIAEDAARDRRAALGEPTRGARGACRPARPVTPPSGKPHEPRVALGRERHVTVHRARPSVPIARTCAREARDYPFVERSAWRRTQRGETKNAIVVDLTVRPERPLDACIAMDGRARRQQHAIELRTAADLSDSDVS